MPVIGIPLARELVDPGMMMTFVELGHLEVSPFLPASIASRRLDSPVMQARLDSPIMPAEVLLTPPFDSPGRGAHRLKGEWKERSMSETFNEKSSVGYIMQLNIFKQSCV